MGKAPERRKLVGLTFATVDEKLDTTPARESPKLAHETAREHRVNVFFSLLLVAPTGLQMFTAHATEMASNPALRLKLILIGAAFLNAGIFHRWPFRTVGY